MAAHFQATEDKLASSSASHKENQEDETKLSILSQSRMLMISSSVALSSDQTSHKLLASMELSGPEFEAFGLAARFCSTWTWRKKTERKRKRKTGSSKRLEISIWLIKYVEYRMMGTV
uniref:Uncharacterized protein n=1 Tax=Salix viminalis TaxID=40686 RepID=A0A6N2KIC5_SALVM